MERSEMRRALIHSAIQIVATEGIDHVKVDRLAEKAGLNVAYLYRVCGGKEQLFRETFKELDCKLRDYILKNVDILYAENMLNKERWWIFVASILKFILDNREEGLFFIRYYYSHYFDTYSHEERKEMYAELIEKMQPAFVEGVDVWKQINYMYDVIYSSVIKIFRKHTVNTEEDVQNIFNLLYTAFVPKLCFDEQQTSKEKEESIRL